MFRDRSTEIDMVILDMILPDVGGGEVFDALRAIDPGALVLLSSGYSLDGQAENILDRGCNDFIQKPFTVEQLSQKMGTVMGQGSIPLFQSRSRSDTPGQWSTVSISCEVR